MCVSIFHLPQAVCGVDSWETFPFSILVTVVVAAVAVLIADDADFSSCYCCCYYSNAIDMNRRLHDCFQLDGADLVRHDTILLCAAVYGE